MKLPNFDDFEPFIEVRRHMNATRTASITLVKIDRMQSVDVQQTTPDQPAAPSQPPTPKPPPVTIKEAAPPVTPSIVPPPSTAPKEPAKTPANRPQIKTAPRAKKSRKIRARLLPVIVVNAVLVALLAFLITHRKIQLAEVNPPSAPITQTSPAPIQPPPAQESAPPTEVAAPTEPTTAEKSAAPSEATAEPTDAAPDMSAEKETDTPASPDAENTETEVRASDILSNAPPAAQPPAKGPSEFDLNALPFSDALRGADQQWYIKVQKQKKKQRIDSEP